MDEQTKQGILGHFCQFSGKWEFSQKTWLPQYSVLMIRQVHVKYETNLMSQFWEKMLP